MFAFVDLSPLTNNHTYACDRQLIVGDNFFLLRALRNTRPHEMKVIDINIELQYGAHESNSRSLPVKGFENIPTFAAGHYYLTPCTTLVSVLAVCASIFALYEWTSACSTIYATANGTRNSYRIKWNKIGNIRTADKKDNEYFAIENEKRHAPQCGSAINHRITALFTRTMNYWKCCLFVYI